MTWARSAGRILLALIFAAALLAPWIAPYAYDEQHREAAGEAPSAKFPLGTDDLGRDRLSRLLHGARVSLLLAPAAAFVSAMLGAVAGAVAGWRGGWTGRAIGLCADLFLSLPWMFLLLAVRALLPLNASPAVSLAATFGLLSVVGWAGPSRVFRTAAAGVRDSGFLLQARACGCRPAAILFRHLIPALRPAVTAQFWISVPLFVLSEANLSLLGLGVAEPLPSIGSLLADLQDYASIPSRPWVLAPAAVLVTVMVCLQLGVSREEATS